MGDLQLIREAIINALPVENANFGDEPAHIYIPPGHIKALRLESSLVVGARGVGKSFWTAALGSVHLRRVLEQPIPELAKTDVYAGHAQKPDNSAYPSQKTFEQLLQISKPYDIWRCVVVRRLAMVIGESIPCEDWTATLHWVIANPEPIDKILEQVNRLLVERDRHLLFVFDALDYTSSDWKIMDNITKDLLRVALGFKPFSRLHVKVFLREDQVERTITDFPDASKLLATRAELVWAANDLHGLLWQLLCNAPDRYGDMLRQIYWEVVGVLPQERNGVWLLDDAVKRDVASQRALFEKLAGKWMGRDHRRGVPYVWSVSHLGDTRQRTSPRSFLAAIRAAAEDSKEHYATHTFALHFESIKKGVQKASQTRVDEVVTEDYPWIREIMTPLAGLTVPCAYHDIEQAWNIKIGSVDQLRSDRLPPQHLEKGWSGICDDLERLGIFETMKDGRINLPDIYRVGFKLGRKGGVKPIK